MRIEEELACKFNLGTQHECTDLHVAYIKWVVRIMVFPALCFRSRSHVPRLAYGSIPEVGSSKNTVCDPPMRAIAQLQKRNCLIKFTQWNGIRMKTSTHNWVYSRGCFKPTLQAIFHTSMFELLQNWPT